MLYNKISKTAILRGLFAKNQGFRRSRCDKNRYKIDHKSIQNWSSIFNASWRPTWLPKPAILGAKSTKNRSKTVSKLRCKFECIFEGSWIPLGAVVEAKMGPSWGQKRRGRSKWRQGAVKRGAASGFARICRICQQF